MKATETTHTHAQISPTQGCELSTAGLISSDSYPNKHRKASQNLLGVFLFVLFFNGDNQEENTGQTVSHGSLQLIVKQTQQSQLDCAGTRMEEGTNPPPPPPPSGASQHPSQFGQTDALGAQRNPRHASLRETQQRDARAHYPD